MIDVAVVGAGLGGLSAAALLSAKGARVAVFDQHFLPGGFCTSWERTVARGGRRLRFLFDAGVHDVGGLGPGGGVRQLLEALGVQDRLRWLRTRYLHALPGLSLQVPDEWPAFAEALAERFPAERAGIHALFQELEQCIRACIPEGGTLSFLRGEDPALPRRRRQSARWLHAPFDALLRTHVTAPPLRELLLRLGRYRTSRVSALTVAEMAPLFGYYLEGGWYPDGGGSQALPDLLVEVIRGGGGEVRLSTPVKSILVEGGHAAGVELAGGERVEARAVLSNADARRTLLELLPAGALPEQMLRKAREAAPATSAFMVHLGLSPAPPIPAPAIFVRSERGVPLSMWCRPDPSTASEGAAPVTLLVLAPQGEGEPWDRRAPGYAARKRALADRMLETAEQVVPEIRSRIAFQEEASPATFERYAWTSGGAIYGLEVGAWRPPARLPLGGMHLAGAGVFPGPGVEGAVVSGALAAAAIAGELGLPFRFELP